MTRNQYPKRTDKVRVRLTVDVYANDHMYIRSHAPSRGDVQALLSTLYKRFVETLERRGAQNYHQIAAGEVALDAIDDTGEAGGTG